MRTHRVMGALLAGAMAISCTSSDGAAASRDSASGRKPATSEESPVRSTSGAAADVGRAEPEARRTILFLGTSLTAGLGLDPDSAYPQRIQRKIDAAGLPYQVVNAGVSGETSAGLLRRLDWVLKRPADVVVVETGANDGLRGLPITATSATIGSVLDRIKRDRPGATLLLVQMEAPPNMGPEYTRAFHAMFPTLAREHGATLLPFLLEDVAGRPTLNQSDGIHPNNAGEAIVANTVWRALLPVLPQ
jgi:acyl-CoA thioesterase I